MDALEAMQREINQLKRQLEMFQSGNYATTQFVGLGTTARPILTSTSWDGDSFSTTGKTLIDLSAVFGAPAGIKAALFRVAIRDEASETGDYVLILSPENGGGTGIQINCGYVNDRYNRGVLTVPCDANGDVYYQVAASGAGTMDVILQIWGYWI